LMRRKERKRRISRVRRNGSSGFLRASEKYWLTATIAHRAVGHIAGNLILIAAAKGA
jgi:hypothetical protein